MQSEKLIQRRKEVQDDQSNIDLLISEQSKTLSENIDEGTIFKTVLVIPDIYDESRKNSLSTHTVKKDNLREQVNKMVEKELEHFF